MSTTDWKLIALGIFGSACVELLYAWKVYQGRGVFPKRYRRIGFWFVRLLVAFLPGCTIRRMTFWPSILVLRHRY